MELDAKTRQPLTDAQRSDAYVGSHSPEVEWLSSYAVLGPCDYLDIFMAPDNETATKVATMVRTFGHAQTEVCGATGRKKFKELVRHLPPAKT